MMIIIIDGKTQIPIKLKNDGNIEIPKEELINILALVSKNHKLDFRL